jgi:manganese oxidase
VAPGATYTYTWSVPERAGPTEDEESTAFWMYHSHVDESKDINSGLIGPIIITRRGMAREDAWPKDVDREFIIQFGLYDEHLSWYWDSNLKRLYGDPKNYDGSNIHVHDFHHFYTINGYLDGNGQCDRVPSATIVNDNVLHSVSAGSRTATRFDFIFHRTTLWCYSVGLF